MATKNIKIIALGVVIGVFVCFSNVFAYYNPGQTLNPSCSPGDSGCDVLYTSTNGDLIPTVNNSYSLGSGTFQWKNLYASGLITTSGNISTTSTGTISSAGLLTASNGLTLTSGALNLTATSGALTLSGLSSSTISAGSNSLSLIGAPLNLNTTGSGISNIGNGSGAVNITSSATSFKTSTGTDDALIIQPKSGGSNTFDGIITSADLTAGRSWTFPDMTGTVLLSNTGWSIGGNASPSSSIIGATDSSNITLQTVNGVLSLQSGTGNLNIGNDATNKTITIGNSANLTQAVFNTTGLSFTGPVAATYEIGATGQTGTITLGNSSATNTEIIAGGSGATTLQIADVQTAGSVSIGAGMTTGTISIGGTGLQTGNFDLAPGTGAETVTLANGSGVKTLNIGNGVAGNTISIGSGANTSAQILNLSSGAAAANSTVNILTGVATAGTQTLNLGTGASAKTLNLGNSTGTTALNLTSGTGLQTFASSTINTDAFNFNANSLTTADGLVVSVTGLTTGNALQIIGPSSNNLLRIQNFSGGPLDNERVIIGQGGLIFVDAVARDQLYVFGRINHSWATFDQDFMSYNQTAAVTSNSAFYGAAFNVITSGSASVTNVAGTSGVLQLSDSGGINRGCWYDTYGALVTQSSNNPVIETRVQATATATQRVIVGFSDIAANTGITANSNNAANEIFFRKSSSGSNTVWQTVTRSASGSETTNTTTVGTSAFHILRIEVQTTPSEQALFFIDGVLVATHTTGLPAGSTRLGWGIGNYVTANVTDAVNIDYIRIWSDDPEDTPENETQSAGAFAEPSVIMPEVNNLQDLILGISNFSTDQIVRSLVIISQNQDKKITDLENKLSGLNVNNSEGVSISSLDGFAKNGGLTINSDINFYGHIYVSGDSAGRAIIKAGETTTTVNFLKPYQSAPIITLTVAGHPVNASVSVPEASENGFSIEISSAQSQDITLYWHALAQTSPSSQTDQPVSSEESSPSINLNTTPQTPNEITDPQSVTTDSTAPAIVVNSDSATQTISEPSSESSAISPENNTENVETPVSASPVQ